MSRSMNLQKAIEGEKRLAPEVAGRPAKEHMAVLDDTAFGAASEVTHASRHLINRVAKTHFLCRAQGNET